MNRDKAIEALERGEAKLVVLTTVLLKTAGGIYMSFDGEVWEEIESEMIKKNVNT